MSLHLAMECQMEQQLRLLQYCKICKLPIDQKNDQTELLQRIFGSVEYGVCIGCGQEVPRSFQTKGYKNRYGKRWRLIKCQQIAEGMQQ